MAADFDPFKDEEENEVADHNEISVTFKAHGGFDAPWIVVRGSAEYLADLFKIKDFDGRVSTLMNRVVDLDSHYKKVIGGGAAPKG
jgi:hypothetical protein